MRTHTLLIPIGAIVAGLLVPACSRKTEAPPEQKVAAQAAPAPAPAAPAANTQLDHAQAVHQAFAEAFFKIYGLRNADLWQRRSDFTAKALDEANALFNGTGDPEAKAFLARYVDWLQEYTDVARKVVALKAEIDEADLFIRDHQARIGEVPPDERQRVILKLRSLALINDSKRRAHAAGLTRIEQLERSLRHLK